jgi:glycosyltransferase involved in cell wall biosynthesis
VSGIEVLHVMPNLTREFGGPVEALIGFVAAGAHAGVRSTVIGPACPPADRSYLQDQLPRDTRLLGERAGLLPAIARLAATADVVHVHGLLNPVSSAAAWLARARDRPVVIDPFGTLSHYTFTHRRRALKRLYFSAIDGPAVRRAHAMHFTTTAERDEAMWHGIDFTGRAHVVPPPWRATPTAPRVHSGETVLFLSRLHPKKGLDTLLAAWPLVRARRGAARLIIAGSGDERFVASLPRPSGVEFVGFVTGDQKAECLATADIFVLPSHHENFGVAVLEAVAAGVPAVVTPGVQLAPWIAERGLGVVTERDPEALATAILGALDDDTLRNRVAEQGAAAVTSDFGIARVAPALLDMYRSAMARCTS